MIVINFPEKLYVGVRTETGRLGFATPFGNDAAFEKRKETVDRWCVGWGTNKKLESFVIDNVPVSGFTTDKSVVRSSTSNKWFRILDPRGFYLEITTDNLAELLMSSEVNFGLIDGNLVWGRIGAVNYLFREDSQDYQKFLAPKESVTLEVGDHVETPTAKGVYMGDFYVHHLTSRYIDIDDKAHDQPAYYWNGNTRREEKIVFVHSSKPYLVFMTKYKSDEVYFDFARKLSDKAVITKATEPVQPLSQNVDMYFFHKTKEEHEAFILSAEDMRARYDKQYGRYYPSGNSRRLSVSTTKYEDKLT